MIPPDIALLVWPVIGIAIVFASRPSRGVTLSLLCGLMLLPEAAGFDLPLLPPITKYEIVSLSALLGLVLAHPRTVGAARPGRGVDVLILLLLASAFATAYTNRDSLPNGADALSLYDGLSMAIRDLLFLGFPFLLGRIAHRSPRDLEQLLRMWLATAAVASLFALLEVRLTPFMHEFFYGYRARGLAQEFRWGGARPMLFMPNGLALSMFFSVAVICSAVLSQTRGVQQRALHYAGAFYLSVVLVLSRSFASMIYGLSGALATIFLRVRMQLLAAMVLACIGVAYPITRSFGWVSGQSVVELARHVSDERAKSFNFRLLNEDALVDFAKRRPLFGFGVFGNRNRFLNPATRMWVILDGYWIILFTGRGAVGLGLTFLLLVLSVLRAWRRANRFERASERAAIAGVALILGIWIVDLLPNGLFSFLPFYIAGALWGGTSFPSRRSTATAPPASEPVPPDAPTTAPRRRSLASLAGRRRGR